MSSHAGAASAPLAPIRNDVASSEVGPANPADTAAANATEIATAMVCVRIRSRRGSTTSVSAPAGKVRRKSGRVVATWTAETSLGLGLRLVIIQAEPVSNIAKPTLDSEVAMRMTMKAGLRMRPEGGSALDDVCVIDVQFGGQVIRPTSGRGPVPRICVPALRGFGKRMLVSPLTGVP